MGGYLRWEGRVLREHEEEVKLRGRNDPAPSYGCSAWSLDCPWDGRSWIHQGSPLRKRTSNHASSSPLYDSMCILSLL